MSARDPYSGGASHQTRSPKSSRRAAEMASLGVQGSPSQQQHQSVSSKHYSQSLSAAGVTSISQPVSARGSPVAIRNSATSPSHHQSRGRKGQSSGATTAAGGGRPNYGLSRSSNNSPVTIPGEPNVPHSYSSGTGFVAQGYYSDEQLDPAMDPRGASSGQTGAHRSRSATRGSNVRNYHSSLDRDPERDFLPVGREPRERSLDRVDVNSTRHSRSRERSLDRAYRDRDDHVTYRERETAIDGDIYGRDNVYGQPGGRNVGMVSSHGSNPNAMVDPRHGGGGGYTRDSFIMELQSRLNELQNQYGTVKRELDATTQKLGSSMHSIKTFWSPELKKERALRKEEAAKYSLINDQLKILRNENQKQAQLMRQLEEELRMSHGRNQDAELQQHLEALYQEKDHMTKEIFLLRETVKELEMRIETQKQTLAARDESIKKLMEMLQNKGIGSIRSEEERLENDRLRSRLIELETRARHLESLMDVKDKDLNKMEELKIELNKRDQEMLAMGAKMRTLEEQHQDYQRHIAVLKESLCAKEEHYNMLQADVEELRQRLEEKNKLIEKRTHQSMTSSQDRNRLTQELQELRDHMDIKDRKINVLQRKIENLEDLLKEKDNQVDMARARLTAIQAHHSSSEGALSSLEEAISDKEKQISQLREQRDRAEQERNEERELHEREIAEYKMKMHGMESEMEKLQTEIRKLQQQAKQGAKEPPPELIAMQKQMEERHKTLEDLEKKLKKRKEKLDQMEKQLHEAAAGNNDALMMQLDQLKEHCLKLEKTQAEREKEVAKLKAEKGQPQQTQQQQAELERLLQIMSGMEEDKFMLNKQIKELQDQLKDKDAKLNTVKRTQQTDKTRSAQMLDEARRRETEVHKDAAKAQELLDEQRERIEEMEEALRETVHITAQCELSVAQKEADNRKTLEKLNELQEVVDSFELAKKKGLCPNCSGFQDRVKFLEDKATKLKKEQKKNIEDLFDLKQEAISAAISEKDAHLALLEMSGIKNAQTSEEVDRLRAEKRKLMEKMKEESENRLKMLLELGIPIETNGKAQSKDTSDRGSEVSKPKGVESVET